MLFDNFMPLEYFLPIRIEKAYEKEKKNSVRNLASAKKFLQ